MNLTAALRLRDKHNVFFYNEKKNHTFTSQLTSRHAAPLKKIIFSDYFKQVVLFDQTAPDSHTSVTLTEPLSVVHIEVEAGIEGF